MKSNVLRSWQANSFNEENENRRIEKVREVTPYEDIQSRKNGHKFVDKYVKAFWS